MTLFAIHKKHGRWNNLDSKPVWEPMDNSSLPLLWEMNRETLDRVGCSPATVFAFPHRDDAERVMAEVPALFDMDDAQAATLHIVPYVLHPVSPPPQD